MGNNDAREQLEVCKQEYNKLESILQRVRDWKDRHAYEPDATLTQLQEILDEA